MKASSPATFLPQWTRRVAMEGSGRDPLGLSRVSDNLTGFLLPNIITTTDRARYFSFYAWAWADIQSLRANAKKTFTPEAIRIEFQRREAAFAVASFLDRRTDLPIVGIRQVEAHATGSDDDDDIDLEFPVLPSNQFGGFGQYYGGCLHGLELLKTDSDGMSDVPTPLGEKLAAAFAASTAAAPYLTEGTLRKKRRITRGVLRRSAKHFSLDGLSALSAKTEREALIRIFFSLGEKPTPAFPLNRQGSLGLFLHVLSAYKSLGIEVPRREVDEYAIYWPHYYGGLRDKPGKWHPYQVPGAFAEVQGFWRQFCAHQLAAFAIEEFLAAVLTALSAHPNGLSEADMVGKLTDASFTDFLTEILGDECDTPKKMLVVATTDYVNAIDGSAPAEEVREAFSDGFPLVLELTDRSISSRDKIVALVGTRLRINTGSGATYAQFFNECIGAKKWPQALREFDTLKATLAKYAA